MNYEGANKQDVHFMYIKASLHVFSGCSCAHNSSVSGILNERDTELYGSSVNCIDQQLKNRKDLN